MKVRFGLIEICAAIFVVVAVALPQRGTTVHAAYLDEGGREHSDDRLEIATQQARLARDPGDGDAAARLAEVLVELGHHDQALRVAGKASASGSPSAWKAHLAVSSAHADRIELHRARDHARTAHQACLAAPDSCTAGDEARLRLYLDELDAGVAAIEAGADPRRAPEEYQKKLRQLRTGTRFRPVRIKGGSNR